MLLAIVSFMILGSNVLVAGVLTQARPITMTIKKSTLNNVLNQIKDQSGVKILFNVNSVKNIECDEVTFSNTPVDEALKTVLEKYGFRIPGGRRSSCYQRGAPATGAAKAGRG
ncbi:hypothetical protein MASR2M69_13460 [Bacteroidota bacterium]